MWISALDRMLTALVRFGDFEVEYPNGKRARYGDGTGVPVRIALSDQALVRKIVLNPDLGVGEGYMNGALTIENDDLSGFLALAVKNLAEQGHTGVRRLGEVQRRLLRGWTQLNTAVTARLNVAHHYDLSGALYDLFLDRDKQYSCAYFARPDMTLEEAQAAKKAHIAGKLLIERDMHVLDIGCGWGGMGLTLARDYGARVTGVTLSEEQLKVAQARAKAAGLEDRVEFRLADYRTVTERFDRIVSVGMFEHVGLPHYREYFRNVYERLAPDGVALIHTIGRVGPPGDTSPWIDRYIFPGGYVPSLSEMTRAIEDEDLYTTDIEIWRLHYAETLRHWYDRFVANEDKARELYDERFCRMWRYYLIACEMTFRHNRQAVYQVQLAHDQSAVPLTRAYLYPNERGEIRHAAE